MQQRIVEYVDLVPETGEIVPVDQTGGTISLRNGVPVNPLSIQEAVASSLDFIAGHMQWLAPLLETVATRPTCKQAQFFTYWSAGAADEDAAKHDEYSAYLRDELDARWPWLMSLLDSAGALVLVIPGSFTFCTSLHLGISFEIPQLRNLTYLTPFPPEDGEAVH
jgi:hypothetical protein